MSGAELRKELHNYIDKADDTFLKMMHAMSKEYKNSEVAGYKIDGSPITQKDLRNRVKAASKRVKDGHYTTQEEVGKETLVNEFLIKESEEDIKNGNVITHDLLLQEIKTWRHTQRSGPSTF